MRKFLILIAASRARPEVAPVEIQLLQDHRQLVHLCQGMLGMSLQEAMDFLGRHLQVRTKYDARFFVGDEVPERLKESATLVVEMISVVRVLKSRHGDEKEWTV
jgi:hypothetical protein